MYTEGVIITTNTARSIVEKTSSGANLSITWDMDGQSFMPSCLVNTAPPEALQAITGVGDEDIEVQLDIGVPDILGYVVEDSKEYFPAGRDRSLLSLGRQGLVVVTDTAGEPIELITEDGLFPVEVLLDTFSSPATSVIITDTFGEPIELILDSGITSLELLLGSALGGRYLSSLPVVKQ
jgi:hypothetical protein